ncbi:MAG: hydrogenase formation protein HypD [Candidatus Abyssobacteria bacterium SURF_5]|uniref:Hydrogenase formation protein HypD n=1 Tax=Abyssobacteria bacterium (strain SURF_5) TaxID=2093360 RepID=A0A3A4NP00_ABYX5|nr:MAG: hydrogenase formation protein HypD [Candidatus Abyssubacteria bacterium SURF_5]
MLNDPRAAVRLVREIEGIALRLAPRRVTLMEVCGTHTAVIVKSGLRRLLPKNIQLVSGPGCPVCVTPPGLIDAAITLAGRPRVILVTFGDMLRVPGGGGSLEAARAGGADVRVIYSPTELFALARENRSSRIVFFSAGFETTAPSVAWTLMQAERSGIENLFVIAANKLLPPALEVLAQAPDLRIDGFICPGHVSAIIGASAFEAVARTHHVPAVVSGFEPVDILLAVLMLLRQVQAAKALVEIAYMRAVTFGGNRRAQVIIRTVFKRVDSEWRGFSLIPDSGLGFTKGYARFDAVMEAGMAVESGRPAPGCMCGEILRGVKSPEECGLFGTTCTPETPIGPCIVSSEGTCAAHYNQKTAGIDDF